MIDGNRDILQYFVDNFVTENTKSLDVGTNGQSEIFAQKHCQVTGVGLNSLKSTKDFEFHQKNFLFFSSHEKFDNIWCSHTLEHVTNINLFLRKLITCATDDAVFGIIVPRIKDNLVGGHINLFTPATLCYNIILAGQSLLKAEVIVYKYNIAILWKRNNITLPLLQYDRGDIETLSQFFPIPVSQNNQGTNIWFCINSEKFFLEKYNLKYANLAKDHDIPIQLYDPAKKWNTYFPVLKHALASKLKNGLDFGPGSCASFIIANMLELNITGLDIAEVKHGKNKFYHLQEQAKSNGFKIIWHDTDILPWPLSESQFDFILCFDSLFVDWKEHVDWKTEPSRCEHRLTELMRITKPKGHIYIYGGSDFGIDADKFIEVDIINPKSISFYKCDREIIEIKGSL